MVTPLRRRIDNPAVRLAHSVVKILFRLSIRQARPRRRRRLPSARHCACGKGPSSIIRIDSARDLPIMQRLHFFWQVRVVALHSARVKSSRGWRTRIPQLSINKDVVQATAGIDLAGILILVPDCEALFCTRVQLGERIHHGVWPMQKGFEPLARRENTALSPPGLYFGTKKMGLHSLRDLTSYLVSVIPEFDLVPEADGQFGTIAHVPCTVSDTLNGVSKAIECHGSARTLSMLVLGCGDRQYPRRQWEIVAYPNSAEKRKVYLQAGDSAGKGGAAGFGGSVVPPKGWAGS